MQVEVGGVRLWFDVEGPLLVPDGAGMRSRPTVVLVHGGPGTWDHSYFKPAFGRLAEVAQVVYMDLPGHGRSGDVAASEWSFEACADAVRGFCDAVGVERPVVYGHSMGGMVVMLYGARHPGHPRALVLQSTFARFDLERLAEGFRRFGGDEVGKLARRDYGGGEISDDEWQRVFAAFGPRVQSAQELARRISHPETARRGSELLRRFDVVDQLANVRAPTLVCVGQLDPVTPVEASREIADALPEGLGRLEVVEGAGHFPWLDVPDRYWSLLAGFVEHPDTR